MTKAKIVVAAKVGHRVVVPAVVADLAHVVTHRPLAGSIKRALPRLVVHRVTRRGKSPSALGGQRNRAERAKIWVKSAHLSQEARKALPIALRASVRFRPVHRARLRARVNVRLNRELIGQLGIDLIQPVRRVKTRVMKSVLSVLTVNARQAIGLVANAPMAKGLESLADFGERHVVSVRQRLIRVSV
jgi:hypothetical protein